MADNNSHSSMLYYASWKKWLTIFLCALSVIYAVPNLFPRDKVEAIAQNYAGWLPLHPVNLGLDLQGGAYLLLHVDMDTALKDRFGSVLVAVRKELQKQRIGYTDLTSDSSGVRFNLRDADKDGAAMSTVKREVDSELSLDQTNEGRVTLSMSDAVRLRFQQQVLDQSIEIVRRRVDESGTREPLIQRSGDDRILLQLPGVSDPQQIKHLLGQTAKMTFHLVNEEAASGGASAAPAGYISVPDRDDANIHYIIKREPSLSGETLRDAQAGVNSTGQPAVHFTFDANGARRFAEITRDNVGRRFAIVLDGQAITAPTIREAITGGRGQIDGNFTIASAGELALLLRAGALPAPLNVLEERTVGPGLGQDAVHAGKVSGVLGFLLVLVFMVLSYGRFGIYAGFALTLNIAMIFAVLSVLGATLTLPGIAGIVLTIGIAVDANVLIYERIREELRMGRTPVSAIDTGYSRAMASIIDSNLTTIISGLILFMLGTGPVRGFAVTLTLGVITSMFCAIMVTRLMVLRYLRAKRPTHLHI